MLDFIYLTKERMKEIICKIFGHFDKTETTMVQDTGSMQSYNYKDTCKLCGNVRKGGYTCVEGPTISLKK